MGIFAFFGNFIKKLDGDGNDGFQMLHDIQKKRKLLKGFESLGFSSKHS